MPESGTYGSVRGAPSNGRPYRDRCACGAPAATVDNAPAKRPALPTAAAFAHMTAAFAH
jgi:hypothetical protein